MRIKASGLGGSRNGMPERVNYVYRGTGDDQLPASPRPPRPSRMVRPDSEGWCPDCEYKFGSIGHLMSCEPGG